MSRTDPRRWLVLGLAAFALRAGVAVLTEYKPLFPSYYYHDAVFVEGIAWDMAQAWRAGASYRTPAAPPQRLHAAMLAIPYMAVGRRPLVNKLVNAALGAVAVVLLGFSFRALVSPDAAFAAAALAAAWPSNAFYTSQNFRESPTHLFAFGALACLLPLLAPGARPGARRAAAGAAFLVLTGLLRSHVLAVFAAGLAAGAALAMRSKAGRKTAALALAAALLAPLAYSAASRAVFGRLLPVPADAPSDILPLTTVPPGPAQAPWTPAWIASRRALSQAGDRSYAKYVLGREVGTQIEPDARFDTWLDVALFAARASFQVLFMPLPGLYPMDGKLGRWLASLENLLLLLLAGAAALGLSRARLTPARAAVLACFLAMTAGSALLEVDLGSASRHKLLYLPMLFPFAAEELLRRKFAAPLKSIMNAR